MGRWGEEMITEQSARVANLDSRKGSSPVVLQIDSWTGTNIGSALGDNADWGWGGMGKYSPDR